MRIIMVCLALFISCLAVGAAKDDEAKKALDALQGTWKVVSMVENGLPVTGDKVGKLTMTFKDNEVTLSENEKPGPTAKVKLDPLQKPAEIDFDAKGRTEFGIYELEGDNLKLCMGGFNGVRPRTFESPKESQVGFMVLKRDKK